MKKIVLLILIGIATTFGASAQKDMKIGYTSAEYIMYNHPKMKTVESTLAAYTKQHQKAIQELQAQFQEKYQAYEKGAAMMTETQRSNKETELQNLNAEIEQKTRNAEADLQKRQMDLTKPILDEIQKAIDEVRKEGGFTYILSTNAGGSSIILSGPENNEFDISNKVFEKLGISPPEEATK